MNNMQHIRKKSIGTLVCLLFILSFAISPALLFGDFSGLGTGNPSSSTSNYLYKDKTYIFNLDDFYDDTNLYKTYTGTKFQTEAFDGEALVWSGTISNDTVTPVNNTETHYASPSGHYEATYSFEGDEGVPDGWTAGGGATVNTISDFQGHNKVMTILGDGGAGWDYVYNNFDNQLFGVIELWYATSNVVTQSRIQIQDGGIASICLRTASGGTLQYLDGTPTWHVVGAMSTNTWYHFKIQWYANNTYDLYIDRVLIDSGITFYSNMSTGLDRILIQQYIASHIQYVDAVGIKTGHYEATYSFVGEVGLTGTNIDFVDSTTGNGTIEVQAEKEGHIEVLYMNSTDAGYTSTYHNFDSSKSSGTVELWQFPVADDVDWSCRIMFYDSSGKSAYLYINSIGTYGWWDGISGTTIATGVNNQWNHLRFTWDGNDMDVYANGGAKISVLLQTGQSSVNKIRLLQYDDEGEMWFDAIGKDWISGYTIGDNLKPYDSDYEIGMNLYPYNINMIKGSYDYTDNMKTNNDIYSNFTSTHGAGYLHEMPSQWSDFTFTNGTGKTIGELETIDADYSVITADYESSDDTGDIFPNEDASPNDWDSTGSPHYEQVNEDPGSPSNTDHVDAYNEFGEDNYEETFGFTTLSGIADNSIYQVRVYTYGRCLIETPEIKVSWNSGSSWTAYEECNLVFAVDWTYNTWSGLSYSLSDLAQFEVRYRADCPLQYRYNEIGCIYVIVYYSVPSVDLDVQVDIQVDNSDCSSVEFLKFSHKTNISATIDLDIWNWDTTTWYEIESVDNFASFDDDSFTLGITSVYVNETFGVRIRFQLNTGSNDFELQIDRLRLDYLTTPAELEFTITFSFTNYNEDLLAMTIQSWQMTNKSQTINFSIWNYDTEAYVQISSSSDTTEALKEYNSTSPSDFLSPTGTAKLHWNGTDTLNDFELHIDYLFIQIFYKLDLVHSKSFSTNGIYRYRWAVIGSIHYTSWVVFEVIDPVSNFYAISESDYTTRWILQNATLTPVENFTDDISGSNWNLYGVSEDSFKKSPIEITNYLLDNYTDVYTGTHWDVGEENISPEGMTWDGTYFWMVGGFGEEVYKYYSNGTYTGIHFDVYGQATSPKDICWDGTFFWVIDNGNDRAYKYTSAGVYTFVNFNVGGQLSYPTGITWDGNYFWVVGRNIDEVFKYTATGTYTGIHFDVSDEDIQPNGITWDGTNFWMVGTWNNEVYKYTEGWVYTGVHFDVGAEDTDPTGITWDGTYFLVVGTATNEVYNYTNYCTIFKKYQGSGYAYMQTNTTELISLRSTVYGTNYTLSSGDYFEIFFQTSSDSLINLILLKDGAVNKTLILSSYGNTNFNNQTAKISVDETVEFDQLKINSTFEDMDYVKVYNIKTKKYTITGDYADFYVGSKRDYNIYLTPDVYNLRISENYIEVINENVTIPATGVRQYVYQPMGYILCRLTLFSLAEEYLQFEDYHINISRSLGGEYGDFWLVDTLFYADIGTYVYIEVYDRFDALIYDDSELAKSYIDLYIEVYSLKIRNEATDIVDYTLQNTDTGSSKSGILFSDEIVEYHIKSGNYSLDYTNYEDMYPREYNFELTDHRTISINSTYHTVYFSLFTYDGLGINHDLVRFYINDERKDFGFNVIDSETANLVVLDFFNNTLANDTIEASAYSEYNIYVEIYSMIILNQFTYEDIVVNITQVGSGVWMTQIIPKQFGLTYRFLPNVEYNITIYFTNITFYDSRIVNLTDNSHIESFGVPTQPSEYPKNVYFGVYTTTGLGINHDLLRFYIDDIRTDFGFNRIENMIVTIVVKDYFNTTLVNQAINTSGIYEYNILITLYSLKVKNEARVYSNYTLKLGALETTGYILLEEIIEYQLASNNYVFDYINNEDGSSGTININLNQNRVYILNSTYYNIYFSLYDLNLHTFYPSQYEFRLNNTVEDFGLVEDLQTDYYNIMVKDRFGTYLFNSIINLRGLNEYRIDITLYELQIRHLAQENSNLTLTEDILGNNYSFIMAPDTIKSIVISSADYTLNWINGEDSQLTTFSIILTEDKVIKLNTIHYGVYFSLYDQNNHRLDDSLFSLYLNSSRKDFGFVGLYTETYNIIVYDWLNVSVFDQIIYLANYNEYNIFITVFELQIRHLAYENSNITLYETTTHNYISFSMAPDTIRSFTLSNSTYNCTWTNGENMLNSFYNITLDMNYILTLDTTYYEIYIGLYNFYGTVNKEEVKFYINDSRTDFGFNTIESDYADLLVLDYFNSTLYHQIVMLNGLKEYSIFVRAYTLIINNEYNTQSIIVKITRGLITVERFIEAQGYTEFKLFPNTTYEIISYTNGTIDEEKEVVLDEEYVTVDFGFFEEDVPYDPEPLATTYLTLFIGLIFFVAIALGVLKLYYKLKERRTPIPPEVLRYMNKQTKRKKQDGVVDNRI